MKFIEKVRFHTLLIKFLSLTSDMQFPPKKMNVIYKSKTINAIYLEYFS